LKTERDAAFYDLESLLLDQQGDLAGAKEAARYWEQERYAALEMEDIELFEEFQANWETAVANVEKV